jgi:hypothetical protein
MAVRHYNEDSGDSDSLSGFNAITSIDELVIGGAYRIHRLDREACVICGEPEEFVLVGRRGDRMLVRMGSSEGCFDTELYLSDFRVVDKPGIYQSSNYISRII